MKSSCVDIRLAIHLNSIVADPGGEQGDIPASVPVKIGQETDVSKEGHIFHICWPNSIQFLDPLLIKCSAEIIKM